MPMPADIGVVDTMIGFPSPDMKETYRFITQQTKDAESKENFEFPVEYMFKDVPDKELTHSDDPVAITLNEMDHWGIEKGMIGVGGGPLREITERALGRHPDRFIASVNVDPNRGMKDVRFIQQAYEEWGIRAATMFPAGTFPQIPLNRKQKDPIYAKCKELRIARFLFAG